MRRRPPRPGCWLLFPLLCSTCNQAPEPDPTARLQERLGAIDRRLAGLERDLAAKSIEPADPDVSIPVELPEAGPTQLGALAAAATGSVPKVIILHVRKDGLYHRDEELSRDRLVETVRASVRAHADPSAVLRADGDADFAEITDALDAIRTGGIKRVSFAAIDGAPEENSEPPASDY